MKILFLDIDGVLNDHKFNRAAQSCTIRHDCMLQLNRIIRRTDAKIVISSAWRYMINRKAMDLNGFSYMLRTHGFCKIGDIIGFTCLDEFCCSCSNQCWHDGKEFICSYCWQPQNRGSQIGRWVKDHFNDITRYVVLDDQDLGITAANHPFVQTVGNVGLTRSKADKVIQILGAVKSRKNSAN